MCRSPQCGPAASASGVAARCSSASRHQLRGSPTRRLPFMLLSTISNNETHAQGMRTVKDCLFHRVRQAIGRSQSYQRHVRVEQIALQRSPSKNRSRSTGASQPGRSSMRSLIPPSRTRRRWSGGAEIWATGLPCRVMTNVFPVFDRADEFRQTVLCFGDADIHGEIIAIFYGYFCDYSQRL